MLRRSMLKFALSASVNQYANEVAFSHKAWERVAAVNAAEGQPALRSLRLSIVPGGCQGFSYEFKFDVDELDADDVVFENDGVPRPPTINADGDEIAAAAGETTTARIVIDKESLKKMQGATIDYHSELKGSAFVVVGNELVDQACACAASFSLQPKKKA